MEITEWTAPITRLLSATIDGSYRSTISGYGTSNTSAAVATHYMNSDKDEDESYYLVVY